MTIRVAALLALGLATGSPAHAQTFEEHLRTSANPHIKGYAFVLSGVVWKDRRIFVCWENPDETAASDLDVVREAVRTTWDANSALQFIGWAKCAPANRGIRILIEDSGPHTKGLGNQLDRKPNGMVLNFTFRSWSPACQQQRLSCIKSIAVHEFGHALGFAHEQNRYDAPGECQQIKQGPNGDLMLTPYDAGSVMNYCNEKYNNDGQLSQLDTAALQYLYGNPVEKNRELQPDGGR